eukprot:s2229_g15.t1
MLVATNASRVCIEIFKMDAVLGESEHSGEAGWYPTPTGYPPKVLLKPRGTRPPEEGQGQGTALLGRRAEAALHRTNKTEAFVCNDGCVVEPYYDECQCSGCEENPFFDCNTCGGCPSTCGFWVSCPSTFACFSGASKPVYVFLDDKCDCELCEDEEWWTCFSCGDCPLDAASDAAVDCTAVPFTCDDGCEISSTMVNNYRCDCSNCEDEDYFTCESCGLGVSACPTTCGEVAADCQQVMDSFVENEERPGEPWRIPLHFYLCDVPGEQSVSSLVTQQMMLDQMDQLKRNFNGTADCPAVLMYTPDKADAFIQFTLDGSTVVESNLCKTSCSDLPEMIRNNPGLLREDGKIKVLVCVVGDTVGIATFPGEPEESRLLMIDGRTMPGGSMSPYNEGKALTHELGHYTSDSGTPSTPAAIPLSKETSLQTHHWRKRRISDLAPHGAARVDPGIPCTTSWITQTTCACAVSRLARCNACGITSATFNPI